MWIDAHKNKFVTNEMVVTIYKNCHKKRKSTNVEFVTNESNATGSKAGLQAVYPAGITGDRCTSVLQPTGAAARHGTLFTVAIPSEWHGGRGALPLA